MRAAAALLMVFTAPASAATLCVNPGGTGGCFASIRAAVDAAEGRDVIDIAAGTYSEGSVTVSSLRARITLNGAGTGSTFIEDTDMWFLGGSATLTDMTLRRSPVRVGQAYVGSRATFVRVVVTEAAAPAVAAIVVYGSNSGSGRVTMLDTAVRGNSLDGVLARGSTAKVTMARSEVSGNGGSGLVVDNRGKVTVEDSTISGNASDLGGGVSLGGGAYPYGGGLVRLRRVTVAGNSATLQGGGVYVDGGTAKLDATILADNSAPQGPDCTSETGPLVRSHVRSSGFNLIEDATSCVVEGRTTLDVSGVDPLLGPLQQNGGPTLTHALSPGSPALDAVTLAKRCGETDQRGVPRPLPCDIGAFEAP